MYGCVARLDITRNGVVAYKLDENLAIYRLSSTSVSHNKFKSLNTIIMFIENMKDLDI